MIAQRTAPKTIEELAEFLSGCDAARTPVLVEGGGTLHGMGTAGAGALLSTTKLNRLIAHEHHDLTCSAQAGMTIEHFLARLAEQGQFVPLDAPLRKKATIGGTMASGWLGPRRHLYGRTRDFAIGSCVVLADGTVARAGGMVVKNVSGYDMTKLYIGSFGTLGVMATINFKTMPLPAARRVLIARLPERSRARAIEHMFSVASVPAAVYCVEGYRKALDGEDGVDGRILIVLEGTAIANERATREIRSALGRASVPETQIVDNGAAQMFERLLDAPIASLGERSLTYRSLGTPESACARAEQLRDAANRRELFTDVMLDVMNGDVFVRLSEREKRAFAVKIEACDDELRTIDPSSCLVSGDAPIRESIAAWGQPPAAIDKMRAMKTRFDPNNILNPGRFTGGI